MIIDDFRVIWNKVCDICEIEILGYKVVGFFINKIKIY